MSQNKFPLIIGLLVAIAIINIGLVAIFPNKPASIEKYSLPESPIDPQIQVDFNELMDRQSVEENFKIEPTIDGNVSWAGRKFVFTPKENLEYNRNYSITIGSQAKSLRGEEMAQDFNQGFKTKELSFLIIDTSKNPFGPIVKVIPSTQERQVLTPPNMKIKDYEYNAYENAILIETIEPETLQILDLDEKKFKPIFNVPKSEHIVHAKWLPFENKILFNTVNAKDSQIAAINVLDLKSKKTEEIMKGETLGYEFYPTPDGRGFIFINKEGSLSLYELEKQRENALVTTFENVFGLSEYGGYLIYTTLIDKNIFDPSNNLILQRSNGDKITVLEEFKALIDKPQMSPKEDRILFKYTEDYAAIERHYQLAELKLDGQQIEVLTPATYDIDSPSYSPDGKQIAFLKTAGEDSLEGGIVTLLTPENFQIPSKITELQIKGREMEWME